MGFGVDRRWLNLVGSGILKGTGSSSIAQYGQMMDTGNVIETLELDSGIRHGKAQLVDRSLVWRRD